MPQVIGFQQAAIRVNVQGQAHLGGNLVQDGP